MCIPSGCNVSDSIVMVISDKMAPRKSNCVSSVSLMLLEVNSVCNIHSRVQPCLTDVYVLMLNNFSHLNMGHILGLREAGLSY